MSRHQAAARELWKAPQLKQLPQIVWVCRHLAKHGRLSEDTARELRGVKRLAALVYTLRHELGWEIATTKNAQNAATYVLRKQGQPPRKRAALKAALPAQRSFPL